MTRPPFSRFALASLVVALVWAAPTLSKSAMAGPEVGLEIDLAIPTGDTSDNVDLGWGIEGRFGYGLPIPAIDLVLEALFDFASFPISDADASADAIRIAGGVRVGAPIPFVPNVFAHIGYGDLTLDAGILELSDDALTWDVGLASDLFSLPIVDLGIHVAYKVIELDEAFTWVGVGLHGTFGF